VRSPLHGRLLPSSDDGYDLEEVTGEALITNQAASFDRSML
jgi:hypothetical protein